MKCRQVMVQWLRSLILLGFSLGIVLILQPSTFALMPSRKLPQVADVVEVSPPETIQQLRTKMEQYQPQVKILSPAADQLIKDDRVSVRFEVKDLPIFKDKTLGLGPHLHVFLDNQPYQAVYDLSQPLVFKEVAPGTHTIRVVAARPWFESFKNPEAYAQVTFHIFIQTEENKPTPHQPLLTYSQPQGSFGTETVLLDFYLSPSPASTSPNNQAANWQVLVSINGSSFYVEDWQPLYIQGLKPGKNWVRLQLMDRQGRKIDNAFNDTIRIVELREQGEDPFSRLMRGDLSAIEAGGMIDPNYKRPQPPAIKSAEPPQPSAAPLPTPAPEIQEPAVKVPQKNEKQTPQVTPAPALKQPKVAPAPALPISPQPLTTQSPAAKSKVPPTKSEDIKTKNLDKIESLEEPLQPKSVETPKATKPQEKSVPKVKPDSSRSQPQKPEFSQSKQAPTPASSSKPTIEARPPKAEATRSKTAAPSVKEDQKPLLPSPASKDRMPSSTPKLEDQEPKATETLITKPPVVKSAPTMQEKLKSSSGSVKAKADKEDAPVDRSKPETATPSPSVTDPRPPQGIETPKTPAQDQSLQLKAKARQLWDKIRPSQGQLEQPKPLPVVPLEHQEPVKAKKSVKIVEDKAGQPVISAPASTTPSQSPDALVQARPSPLSPAKTFKPETPAVKPSELSSPPLITPEQPQPPRSAPNEGGDQSSSQGQKDAQAGISGKTQSESTLPVVKPPKPEPSVFSSLRKRWQQQQQQMFAPTPTEPVLAPVLLELPKAIDQTNLPQQAPTGAMEKKIAPVKTVLPKKEIPKPAAIKEEKLTASEVVGGEQAVSKSDEVPSKPDTEKPKSVTFDPGVWYRHFRVPGKTSGPNSEVIEVNPIPTLQNQLVPE